MPTLLLLRCSGLEIHTDAPGVIELVRRCTAFTLRKALYGLEAIKSGRSMSFERRELSGYDPTRPGVFLTYAGFFERVCAELNKAKIPYSVNLHEDNPKWHDPDLASVRTDIKLRQGQLRMFASLATTRRAQFNGVTGGGKSTLINYLISAYPQKDCGIVVVAKQCSVVDGLYRKISQAYPGMPVGRVGDGSRSVERVTVSTLDSLAHIHPHNVQIMLYDEVHTAGAEKTFQLLSQYTRTRMYGFSGSTECRTDGANHYVEALFGPVRVTIDMEEGQEEGYIPPVEAFFYERFSTPIASSSAVVKKRSGVWRNEERNRDIAKVCRMWEQKLGGDPQVLVMTDTLEHVLRLHKLLPDYAIVYASTDPDKLEEFAKEGLLPAGFVPMTSKHKSKLQEQFERGELRKVISTTTLGTGVDAPGLDVIVRADGGSSEITNIQYRGRVMRGERGIYCDFVDLGWDWSERRSYERIGSAKKAGWPVTTVPL